MGAKDVPSGSKAEAQKRAEEASGGHAQLSYGEEVEAFSFFTPGGSKEEEKLLLRSQHFRPTSAKADLSPG